MTNQKWLLGAGAWPTGRRDTNLRYWHSPTRRTPGVRCTSGAVVIGPKSTAPSWYARVVSSALRDRTAETAASSGPGIWAR